MAKCIYICSRVTLSSSTGEILKEICNRISPDNITPGDPSILVKSNVAYGIMNPSSTLTCRDSSLLLGYLMTKNNDWHIPLNEFPDGSYALFRDGEKYCEVVTDAVASRSVWYYFDKNIFVASTSQRAIIMYIRSFKIDPKVFPWILSTGTLGPSFSWDERLIHIPPDSSIILNKENWTISKKSNPIEFIESERSDKQNEIFLRKTLESVFSNIDLDKSSWILPLSGGYDSRGILSLLLEADVNNQSIRTVTWGLRSSQDSKTNDAYVAKELANKLKVSNTYYANDFSDEPIETIIDRFVLQGEGLTDAVSDYLDGFNMWRKIYEDGVEGIIRGDEGFGCKPYSSALAVRMNQGLTLCSDLLNLRDYLEYGFPLQELPQYLRQKRGETLSTWRDRLFHTYTLPTEFSALSNLKLSFVEQINPLLSKQILTVVRQLPDHLRTGKYLFKKIVNSLCPAISFAKSESSASLSDILKQESIVKYFRKELTKEHVKLILPEEFINHVLGKIETLNHDEGVLKPKSLSIKSLVGKFIPRFIREEMRNRIKPHSLDYNILAFRLFLICRMYEVLKEDEVYFYK